MIDGDRRFCNHSNLAGFSHARNKDFVLTSESGSLGAETNIFP